MNLSEKNVSFVRCKFIECDANIAAAIVNYLIHGLSPGSFTRAALANDATSLHFHAHPMLNMDNVKSLLYAINEHVPPEARGSWAHVDQWLSMSSADRRKVLENHHTILTEEEEVWIELAS